MYGIMREVLNFYQQMMVLFDALNYYLDKPYLLRECGDHIVRKCVTELVLSEILNACRSSPVRGHHNGVCKDSKVLLRGYYLSSLYKYGHVP